MSQFFNIPQMFDYINKLRETLNITIENKKIELNNKCQACNKNEIEIDYKPDDFCVDFVDDDGLEKTKINIMFFCRSCYEKLIETNQLIETEWSNKYWEPKKEEI